VIRHTLTAVPLLVCAALTACDGGSGQEARGADPVRLADGETAAVDDNVFEPAHAVVAAGTEVTWEWVGDNRHNVVGDGFESELQDSGAFSHTFSDAGTYEHVCTLHPRMTGSITVEDA
jgi:plastocyanin